jgi:hypothetical protein
MDAVKYLQERERMCERCNKIHKVENGQIKRVDGTYEDSNVLQFVKCNGEAYLVGIKGKRWK